MWSYYTMKAINDMTKVDEGSTNNFVYFGTDMTHDTEFLQEPEYEPRDVVDNTKYDKTHTTRFLYKSEMMWIHDAKDFRHYQCNLATLVAIGKWLDHLKEIGCYDNTRIIIVSDHGYYIENFVNLLQYDIGAKLDGEAFAPLLMVKDFGAHGKIQTSEEFMTTADTPYLATKDVISNPVNPYTGKPITDQGKANGITVSILINGKFRSTTARPIFPETGTLSRTASGRRKTGSILEIIKENTDTACNSFRSFTR